MPTSNTVVLSQQSRQGNFTSSSFNIPANILRLQLIANIALADKLANGLTLDLDVQHSTDGATNWQSVVGFGWTSYGPAGYHVIGKDGTPIDNPDPSLSFSPKTFLGDHYRLVAIIPNAVTAGLTVSVTT